MWLPQLTMTRPGRLNIPFSISLPNGTTKVAGTPSFGPKWKRARMKGLYSEIAMTPRRR